MFKHGLMALALLTACCVATNAQENTSVEVYFSTEHVPSGLKAGAKVDLMRVDGKSVTRTGKISYMTNSLAPNSTVISIAPVDKPKDPEQAVKVELQVTKAQAATITRNKALLVTVTEPNPAGGTKTVKKPVTFRLEVPK